MNSKMYKSLYVVFNLFFLMLIIYVVATYNVGCELFDLYQSLNSSTLLDDILSLIFIGICIYFMVRSLINIVTKKQHDKKWKTRLFRILSVLTLSIPTLIASINMINQIQMGNGSSYLYIWTLCFGLIVTGIIMTFSMYYLFKTKKNKFEIKDMMPIVITLLFMGLLLGIFNINGKFTRIGTNQDGLNFKPLTLIYYMIFSIIPVQLVNVYNIFNLRIKKIW